MNLSNSVAGWHTAAACLSPWQPHQQLPCRDQSPNSITLQIKVLYLQSAEEFSDQESLCRASLALGNRHWRPWWPLTQDRQVQRRSCAACFGCEREKKKRAGSVVVVRAFGYFRKWLFSKAEIKSGHRTLAVPAHLRGWETRGPF